MLMVMAISPMVLAWAMILMILTHVILTSTLAAVIKITTV
jgi:hypothetical protein